VLVKNRWYVGRQYRTFSYYFLSFLPLPFLIISAAVTAADAAAKDSWRVASKESLAGKEFLTSMCAQPALPQALLEVESSESIEPAGAAGWEDGSGGGLAPVSMSNISM